MIDYVPDEPHRLRHIPNRYSCAFLIYSSVNKELLERQHPMALTLFRFLRRLLDATLGLLSPTSGAQRTSSTATPLPEHGLSRPGDGLPAFAFEQDSAHGLASGDRTAAVERTRNPIRLPRRAAPDTAGLFRPNNRREWSTSPVRESGSTSVPDRVASSTSFLSPSRFPRSAGDRRVIRFRASTPVPLAKLELSSSGSSSSTSPPRTRADWLRVLRTRTSATSSPCTDRTPPTVLLSEN